ncbi:MAG: hypothetical protein E3J60_04580 [Dehalococcoidia bacterium]|nr:MAG: hypothetical protein E3J60_04580 [Dehalococcoidia bacterium]
MPQSGGLSIAAGFAKGFGPQFAASRRQRLEQERKGRQDEIQNLEKTLKLLEKHYPDDPRIISIADTLIEMRGGAPKQQRQQITPMPLKRMSPGQTVSRVQIAGEEAKATEKVGATRLKEEKGSLRKRAEQLMKQRRDFLRGDPIMTALGGLIKPQWDDEVEGVELNNILSDLRLQHGFNYPKSVMNALKLPSQTLTPTRPVQGPTTTGATLDTVRTDPLGLFK